MNPFLAAIYRKDEYSLSVLLIEEHCDNRYANLSEALRVLVGDHVNNRGRRVGQYRNNVADTALNDEDRLKFAQMLLLAGADPNTRGHCENEPLLLQAVLHGDMAMVQLLMDFVCDVNLTDEQGRTCLHAAVISYGKRTAMVGLLLASGADPNVQDINGRTALSVACSRFSPDNADDADIISVLLTDTKTNLSDCHGRTALHYAVESDTQVLNMLLTCDGVDVNVTDNNGFTPLMYAVRQNKIDAVKMLLKHGCDINIQNISGDTALHMIAKMPSAHDLLSLLLNNGADINLNNDVGETPLYIAAQAMLPDIVLCLLQHNADVPKSYKDVNLKPLHLVDQGHAVMAMMIVAGHDWDCSVLNYMAPRQFCFCSGPNPPDYSKILTGDIKANYDKRVKFVEMYGDVKPLKHLCRLQIRKCLGACLTNNIEMLNLPTSLQRYVIMSELPEIMEIFS